MIARQLTGASEPKPTEGQPYAPPFQHLVQFYDDDPFLVLAVSNYLSEGLAKGGAAITVATQQHSKAISKHLAKSFNVSELRRSGLLLMLDARELLSTFMVGDSPDPTLCFEAIDRAFKQTASGRSELRVFGEMVALLQADGLPEAALKLESLWNQLAELHQFSLLCGYPIQGFKDSASSDLFHHVCCQHSHVLPAESYGGSNLGPEQGLREIALLQQKAAALENEIAERRRAEAAALQAWAEVKQAKEELEQRVEQRTRELKEANTELQGFTYTVSHDLRAPLRAIVSTSHMLLEEYPENLSEDQIDLLMRQERNACKVATLVDDLLKLTRLGKHEVRRETIDVSAMARAVATEVVSDVHRVIVEEGITANADPCLVPLVLSNLLENAAKFSEIGSRIWIGQSGPENENAIYVRDEGIGFDMAYAAKVFLPFERLHRDEDYPGTGIGLANVKRIVQRHGGKVWTTSEPGKGATFFFTLG